MTQTMTQPAAAPAHVPPELVRDFTFASLPGAAADPMMAVARALRDGPPLVYARDLRFEGYNAWVATRFEIIREAYQNHQLFSSAKCTSFSGLLGEDWDVLPIEKDQPEHSIWRTLLNPVFAPKRMKAVEADIKATAERLVGEILAKGEADFVADFSAEFPVIIFLSLMGLPLEHAKQFLEWENGVLHSREMEVRSRNAFAIRDYLVEVIAARKAAPTDDVISYVLNTPVEGRPVTDQEALSICFMLFVAGLDTVTAALGFMFKHLAENPDHQQRLRDHPELIEEAVEEYLRAYPIVTSFRLVTRDVEFHGVQLKAGDRIALPLMLAGRDGAAFANPDEVDFTREKLDHISFAAGPHRCIGSHLARRELRVALEEWLTRAPPFRLKPGETVQTHAQGVFGVDYLPLVW